MSVPPPPLMVLRKLAAVQTTVSWVLSDTSLSLTVSTMQPPQDHQLRVGTEPPPDHRAFVFHTAGPVATNAILHERLPNPLTWDILEYAQHKLWSVVPLPAFLSPTVQQWSEYTWPEHMIGPNPVAYCSCLLSDDVRATGRITRHPHFRECVVFLEDAHHPQSSLHQFNI